MTTKNKAKIEVPPTSPEILLQEAHTLAATREAELDEAKAHNVSPVIRLVRGDDSVSVEEMHLAGLTVQRAARLYQAA